MIKKAMILAAGLGTRLRPLTNHCPKPLVPILNRPMLEYHLEQLAELGIQEVAINLHHLSDQIQHHLGGGEKWGLRITYSLEQPVVLGTGGGVAHLRDFFADEPMFLVLNGDILHQIDLRAAVDHHLAQGAVATLIVRPHPGDPGIGSVDVDDTGMIQRVPEMPPQASLYKRMYTGMQVLTPRIFEYLKNLPPPPSCILRTAYRKMLEEGLQVAAFEAGDAFWQDIGDPTSYLTAQWTLLNQEPPSQQPSFPDVTIIPPVYLGQEIKVGANSVIGPNVVLGDHVEIAAGSEISHAVMWSHTRWDQARPLHHAIVYSAGVYHLDTPAK